MRRAAAAIVTLGLVALAPAGARAQGPAAPAGDARDAARALGAQALERYDAGDPAQALELFEKADALYPAPQYRMYVARTSAKLGKLRKAMAAYDAAVSMALPAGAAPSFAEAQKAAADERAELRKRLVVLRVELAGAPADDVTITVDGEPVTAAAAQRIELDPGRHQIAASSARATGSAQTEDLAEGASASVVVTLTPRPTEAPEAPPARPWRTAALASGAVGAAGLVVAIVSGAVLADKRGAILDECPNRTCTPAGRALIDGLGPAEAVNVAGFVTAAVGAVGAGVFVLLDRRAQPPAASVAPVALPGGAGAWVTGRF